MIAIETGRSSNVPDERIEGFERSGSTWKLNVDRYREFIRSATGISPDALSRSDCYRIGNRLEALIDEKRRAGEWTTDLVAEYPDVDSLEQIYLLSRFFRQCHENCLERASSQQST